MDALLRCVYLDFLPTKSRGDSIITAKKFLLLVNWKLKKKLAKNNKAIKPDSIWSAGFIGLISQ